MDLRLYLVITHLMVLDISQANVRLSLEDRVIELGKPLKLRCKITEPRQRRSRQWIGGEDNGLLCFNGVVSDPYKYKEIQEESNTYVLQISNITESDLECPYACRYGFKSDQRILSINSTDIDFKASPSNETKYISYSQRNGFHYLELRLWKVFPVPSCGVKVKEDDERIPLSKLNKTRNGLVFDIIYGTQSTSPLYECGKPIRIECNTEHDSYNFFQPQPNECKVKIRSQTAFIVTCTTAIVCLFVTVVAVFCYIIWKKNSLKVSLKIETNVVEIGKNIRFDCFISDLSKRRSRQWIGGPDNGLLSFNGVSSNPKKYKETEINATYFTLQVFNITEDDLDCPYACRYGFKSDEMVLKVNEQTFKYIPQSSEIQALYTMENGAYSLRINISRVFPTPVCSLVTSKEEHRLKETLTDKDGIFEKVSYFVTSKSPMHDCSSPIKVVCNISDEVLAIPVTHSLGCPARDQSSTMEDKQNVTVIYIVVPIVALLITGIICIIIGYRYRCTQYIQASTNSELNGI